MTPEEIWVVRSSGEIWVVRCVNRESKYFDWFFMPSGVCPDIRGAQFYSDESGAKNSAKRLNKQEHFDGVWQEFQCEVRLV